MVRTIYAVLITLSVVGCANHALTRWGDIESHIDLSEGAAPGDVVTVTGSWVDFLLHHETCYISYSNLNAMKFSFAPGEQKYMHIRCTGNTGLIYQTTYSQENPGSRVLVIIGEPGDAYKIDLELRCKLKRRDSKDWVECPDIHYYPQYSR